MTSINAAIIGCGAIHTCHVQAIRQYPGARLRAIVDTDTARALPLAHSYDCAYYADYQVMLADTAIDVVHICTPHYLHQDMIVAALAAGKHVFTEKPLALNHSQVAAVKHAATQASGLLGVCYQNRWNPTSRRIKSLLDQHTLGRMAGIRAVLTWQRTPDYYQSSPWRGAFATEGGSLLINQAIHTLDLMQWFGDGVSAVKGAIDSTFLSEATDGEDCAMASMLLSNGARGLFYASNCHTRDAPLFMEIHCEKGVLQLHNNSLWLLTPENTTCLVNDDSSQNMAKPYWGNSHNLAVASFYQAISSPDHGEYVDLHQASVSLTMVESIYRSAQLQRWVTL